MLLHHFSMVLINLIVLAIALKAERDAQFWNGLGISMSASTLWCLAEEDLLRAEVPYELRDTGQGVHRVQGAPQRQQTSSAGGTPQPRLGHGLPAAARARAAVPSGAPPPEGGGAGAAPTAAAADRRVARKAQNRMQSIMRLLDESADELEAIDIDLVAAGADAERSREIAVSRKAVEDRVQALEREWEELEAVVD